MNLISTVFGQLRTSLESLSQRNENPNSSPGLRPAPMGRKGRVRIGIVTIIEEEFEAAQRVFNLHENVAGTGYFVSDSKLSGHWDLALLQAADRSNIPIAADVTDFMEDLRPQVLVLLGIAGGLCDEEGLGRDEIRPGDVLFADQVSYVEFLKLDSDGAHN